MRFTAKKNSFQAKMMQINAVAANDLAAFDRALFGHVNLIVTRSVRALLLALSGSRLAGVPEVVDTRRYYQHLSRFSAAFTIVSDTAMGTLGGSLKRREKLSGRLADALAYLYLASAALKRYHDEPKTASNFALVRWSVVRGVAAPTCTPSSSRTS